MSRRAMTPAERMALLRRRRAAGRRIVTIEIDEALVGDALAAGGFVARADADDPGKVKAALREAVRQWSEDELARAMASK